jgi:hypothetical protein
VDLVISVDTSVAHVAGALGRPLWVLLPFSPDWRWLLERADSPWYPGARLLRQPRIGDWSAVDGGSLVIVGFAGGSLGGQPKLGGGDAYLARIDLA